MTIKWEDLQKNKREIPPVHGGHSSELVACIDAVRSKFPNAELVDTTGKYDWQVKSGDDELSGVHKSQFECWLEAKAYL